MKTPTTNGAVGAVECQVVCEPERDGAPLERSPSFLRARLTRIFTRAELRVWLAPLGRLFLVAVGLACVALLGHSAERTSRYGVPLPDAIGREAVSLRSPSTNAQLGASQPAEPPEERSAPASPNVPPPVPTAPLVCPAPPPCPSAAVSAGRAPALTPEGKVVLNEATVEDFMRLPGVGEKRAQAMLALREKLGRFKKLSDLLRVKGVGYKSMKKFAELAVVDRDAVPREGARAPTPPAP